MLTLTKRMAEDLAEYLEGMSVRVRYLHSEIEALERVEILRELRLAEFDVLVGINLLREGLDLPEVSLVAILDADKEGFLRSARSLMQISGRAARNASGRVLFYADNMTDSMRKVIDETERRRTIQREYNEAHGITPQTIVKSVEDVLRSTRVAGLRREGNRQGCAEGFPDLCRDGRTHRPAGKRDAEPGEETAIRESRRTTRRNSTAARSTEVGRTEEPHAHQNADEADSAPALPLAANCGWLGGCRKLNDEPPAPQPAPLQGSYVGVATINDSGQNMLLNLIGPDSSGHISGTIYHGRGSWNLAHATLDATGDTLRFSYRAGDLADATDSAWALVEATGLRVHFILPAGIPVFDLNREVGGTNMTGLWAGEMYSRFLDSWRSAIMDMSQTGELYGGIVDVPLVQNAHCRITTGVTSGGSFQLSGILRMGQTDYPVVFTGHYATLDSLRGNWQTDGDDGSFSFRREF